MIEVLPIAIPSINWRALIQQGSALANRPVTKSIDMDGMSRGLRSFLAVIDCIRNPESKANSVLRESSCILGRHLLFTFLIKADIHDLQDFAFFVPLDWEHDRRFAIASATLRDWVGIVVQGSRSKEGTRQICNQIFNHMAALHLQDAWNEFQRRDLGDGTFLLI